MEATTNALDTLLRVTTPSRLATILGVTDRTIRYWRDGERTPETAYAERMVELAACTTAQLEDELARAEIKALLDGAESGEEMPEHQAAWVLQECERRSNAAWAPWAQHVQAEWMELAARARRQLETY